MTGEEIKHVRTLLKLSQEKFAQFLGVSFQTVSKWERGKSKPSHLAISRIKTAIQNAKGK